MNKYRFLREVTRQLEALYRSRKSGIEPSAQAKSRCEGFMKAGEFMRLVTQEELRDTIERVHEEVLGESVEERGVRLKNRRCWPAETTDYSEFETPTYERGHNRR
ncbi:hypothetical protein ACH42_01580 [Endozoicomonas sp. (ex Bugula neritina AB1)]|nr:hypothetical protein ACH42_01580 [Endozoicomonas sp. (ex Bugula neritina AB1)]